MGITFALTSCNRLDLLDITIKSFMKYNTHPIDRYVIIEDSGLSEVCETIKSRYPQFEVMCNLPKLGQTPSIDKMYETIDTEYIFHCEDDWEFVNSGFIEKSLVVLKDPKILLTWIRDDTMSHPQDPEEYEIDGLKYKLMSLDWGNVWHGFTWNPALRRLSDYKLIAPFTKYMFEHKVGDEYKRLGFRCAKLPGNYVTHIGWGRHVG